jgi:hypothetical protein
MSQYLHSALVLVAALTAAGFASAQENPQGAIDGEFRLAACATGQAPFCNIYFELHGEVARALYENMRSEAKPDVCTEGLVKIDKGVARCFKTGDDDYSCDVGYDFAGMKVVLGDVSC